MQIVSGVMPKPVKVVLYGPEGIGKSTFASMAPNPLYIDTEGSTTRLDVRRIQPAPESWTMILEQVRYVLANPSVCGTLIVDTADWAQKYCIDSVCAQRKMSSIEDAGYGKGYTYAYEEFGRLLNLLDQVIDRGINVILTAHAAMRKFEQPDEMGSYDRWELKLINSKSSSIAGMVKEWADMVLFANYETIVVKNDQKKGKAQGGQRVMYTTHHPCWDAKNRFGLPEKLTLDFSHVAHCFLNNAAPARVQHHEPPAASVSTYAPPPAEKVDPVREVSNRQPQQVDNSIPPALRQLMEQNQVTEAQIRHVVSLKGYYPEATPIQNYDPDFINGVLVAAWPQVYNMIKGA